MCGTADYSNCVAVVCCEGTLMCGSERTLNVVHHVKCDRIVVGTDGKSVHSLSLSQLDSRRALLSHRSCQFMSHTVPTVNEIDICVLFQQHQVLYQVHVLCRVHVSA
jgi:hypothetical protein